MKWFMKALGVIPFVMAAIIEGHYKTPTAANWWLAACLLLALVIGTLQIVDA